MYTYVAYTYMYTVGICVCRVFALEGLLRLVIPLHTYTHVWRIRICIALAYMYLECWREKAFLGLVFPSIPSNLYAITIMAIAGCCYLSIYIRILYIYIYIIYIYIRILYIYIYIRTLYMYICTSNLYT